MTNFDSFVELLDHYLEHFSVRSIELSNLHETSKNDAGAQENYIYNGNNVLQVVDMDTVAKKGYKKAKGAEGENNNVNTADAFVINVNVKTHA